MGDDPDRFESGDTKMEGHSNVYWGGGQGRKLRTGYYSLLGESRENMTHQD